MLLGFKNFNFSISFVSSLLSLSKRKEIIDSFKNGAIKILICTDSISRGIDIPTIDCVINYDVPIRLKRYIHRIGRTARAGNVGMAITILIRPEVKFFKD